MAGNLLCSPSTLCRHIGLLFGERIYTLFASSDKKISGFTRPQITGFVADFFFSSLVPSRRYRIRCGFIFFHSKERIYFYFRIRWRIRRLRVDDSRIWKKKLRIRNFPDTSGRGLKLILESHSGSRMQISRQIKVFKERTMLRVYHV